LGDASVPQNSFVRFGAVALTLAIAGCAGIGVVETSDPHRKLDDALSLLGQDRPIIAERLINEAIQICTNTHDTGCLADAYKTYGLFFRSDSVNHWLTTYVKTGFLDKSATYMDRLPKAIEYLQKAATLYGQLGLYDALTNDYLIIAITYYYSMGDRNAACAALGDSLSANHENLRHDPTAKVILPKGFSSYYDYIADQRTRFGGCS
jgi:tetratricopeptide (TPR) repeat protein